MNLKTSRYVTVVICALVLALTSCQQEGSAEKAGKKVDQSVETAGKKIEAVGEAVSRKVETAVASLDDTAITAEIKAKIVGDSLLKVAEIEVVTTNGVVTLNGSVSSQASVDRAREIASGVKDVKSVENNLTIKST
jgi:hyperosmotically inducible periplasmic protein